MVGGIRIWSAHDELCVEYAAKCVNKPSVNPQHEVIFSYCEASTLVTCDTDKTSFSVAPCQGECSTDEVGTYCHSHCDDTPLTSEPTREICDKGEPAPFSRRILTCVGKRLKSSVGCPYGCIYFDDYSGPSCKSQCAVALESQREQRTKLAAQLKRTKDLFPPGGRFDRSGDIRYLEEKIRENEQAPQYCADDHTVVTCGYGRTSSGVAYGEGTKRTCSEDKRCSYGSQGSSQSNVLGCR
jgi:hypothetical protein